MLRSRGHRFPGGARVPEMKATAGLPVRELPAPARAAVFLSQHAGAPARAVVGKGDRVVTGQLIGEPGGFVSAPVHSPVTGTVAGLERAITTAGLPVDAIIIESDADRGEEYSFLPALDWQASPAAALLERVREAGVVGLGGAAFPAGVKFAPPKPVDTLIINGCECEPCLTADHRLMLEKAPEVVEGSLIAARILGVRSLWFAIEDNKVDALRLVAEQAAEKGASDGISVRVAVLESRYPQGAEKAVIYALLRKEVPSGGLPMDVGVVVSNVGTAVAVREAVCQGRPLYRRVVTVAGAVARPANLLARIGTPLADLVSECGGVTVEEGAAIMGGPMMGLPLPSLEFPLVKGTSGLVVLGAGQLRSSKFGPCIRCGRCVDACPMRLQPWLFGICAEKDLYAECGRASAADCMECGVCTYVCPARRPNLQWIRLSKAVLAREREKKPV